MDVARPAAVKRSLIRFLVVVSFLACGCLPAAAQAISPSDAESAIKQLFEADRWQDVVRLAQRMPARSADTEFYYGTALARLERWNQARQAFLAGQRLRPVDKRFPLELAGVAFKQRNYPGAARQLRRALKLDPEDSYASDFLGSVYFLEGNLYAALKYWNRVGKPRVEQVQADPAPRVSPVLLDRAFAFAPASKLQLSELYTTENRVRGLDIFPHYRFELVGQENGSFDVVFHNQERNGWGRNKLEGLLATFGGLPFQSIHFDLYNLGQAAISFKSMYRWDAQRRRAYVELSGPIRRDPKWRYDLSTDWRSENWTILTTFTDAGRLLGGLNLRREAISAGVHSFAGARWGWSTGLEVSHRDFRSVFPGVALTPDLLGKGYQLKHLAELDFKLLRVPERRLSVESSVSTQIGRLWSQPQESFAKLQAQLSLHWFPLPQGDDYEMQESIRFGRTFGDLPFDELFLLGMMRDNDLWMRAHLGVRDGRKGSAPIGRNYFLSNWEADKNVYRKGPLTVKAGPFVDMGTITDPVPGLGSHKWLWDMGVQVKPRVFGITAVLSYGRDLRSGSNAVYLRIGP